MGFKTYIKFKLSQMSKTANKLSFMRNCFIIVAAVFAFQRDLYYFGVSIGAAIMLQILNDYRRGEHTHWDRERARKKAEGEDA